MVRHESKEKTPQLLPRLCIGHTLQALIHEGGAGNR